jgi:hypothetical protein
MRPAFLEKPKERPAPLNVILKRKFGTWQEADRNFGLIDGSEAAGGGAGKACCYQLVASSGWP